MKGLRIGLSLILMALAVHLFEADPTILRGVELVALVFISQWIARIPFFKQDREGGPYGYDRDNLGNTYSSGEA